MRKIMVVTDVFPFPPITGGMLRDANLIMQLAKYYDIELISYSKERVLKSRIDISRQYCEKVYIYDNEHVNYFKRIINIFSSKCDAEIICYSKKMKRQITELLKNSKYEFVIAERLYSFQYFDLGCIKNQRIIIDMHDVEREAVQYMISQQNNLLKRIRSMIDIHKVKRLEKRMLDQVFAVSFVSERDKQIYCNLDARVSDKGIVVKNGVTAENAIIQIKNKYYARKHTILFVGSLLHYPNVYGLVWFIKEVWPTIKHEIKDARFIIAGSGDIDRDTKRIIDSSEDVELLGYVERIEEAYSQAECAIVPLLSGSGTRLKILESFSLEIPVISTTIGASGLDCTNGKHILIADTALEFAESVLRILNDDNLASDITKNAKKLVTDSYTWDKIVEKFVFDVQTIARQQRPK